MNTSSQNPGGLPPGLAPVRSPMPDGLRAAYAAYGVALPYAEPSTTGTRYDDPWEGSDVPYALRSPYPEPAGEGPACAVCGAPAGTADEALYPDPAGRRYRSGAQVLLCAAHKPTAEPPAVTTLQAAAAVMAATMKENGDATSQELAEAERTAGILFDAEHVEAVRQAALEQARAEYRAELAEAHTQLAAIAGSRRQVEAVLRLCEGRRGDDLLLVSAVAVAAECGTTALDGYPMELTWTRTVNLPDDGRRDGRAIVECTSSYGGRAELTLEGDQRQALASLLDAEIIPDIHAPCPHSKACGRHDDEIDADDPALWGWARLDVAGLDGDPAWYCSPPCVFNALARAGAELERIEQRAAEIEQIDDAEYGLQVAEAMAEDLEDAHGDEGGAS